LIASTKPDLTITSGSTGQLAGVVRFHTWSSKIDLSFPSQNGRQITYKDNLEPIASSPASNVGRLSWQLVQGTAKQADIKCVDAAGNTVVTINVHDGLSTGKVEIWRLGLEKDVLEQIIVSGMAEIEDWRKKCENAGIQAAQPGILAGTLAAQNFSC
jgi:hypothetical protein